MWVQGRIGWLMARLYNHVENRSEWLEASRHAVDFILAHGFDSDGRIFYSVTREGKPLRKRRYLFSEIFAIMGFAECAKAAKDPGLLERSKHLMRFRAGHQCPCLGPPRGHWSRKCSRRPVPCAATP